MGGDANDHGMLQRLESHSSSSDLVSDDRDVHRLLSATQDHAAGRDRAEHLVARELPSSSLRP